jgi:LysR family transcriptional regulator, glycine cleavage system transcriptional activator
LFERHCREVRLTADGLKLLEPLSAAFWQIEAAVSKLQLRMPRHESLVVTTTPSLAATWLVPRLGKFQALHPNIEVRVNTSIQVTDMRSKRADVALRHGFGAYPGFESIKFYSPQLVLIGSTTTLQNGPPIRSPADCLGYPLLHDRDRSEWSQWFDTHGVKDSGRRATHGPSFENDVLLIQAVIAGQGLALVRDIYAKEDIRARRITIAYDAPRRTSESYFIVAPPETMRCGKVGAFRNWILEEGSR